MPRRGCGGLLVPTPQGSRSHHPRPPTPYQPPGSAAATKTTSSCYCGSRACGRPQTRSGLAGDPAGEHRALRKSVVSRVCLSECKTTNCARMVRYSLFYCRHRTEWCICVYVVWMVSGYNRVDMVSVVYTQSIKPCKKVRRDATCELRAGVSCDTFTRWFSVRVVSRRGSDR